MSFLYLRSLFSDPNTKESTALNLVPLTPTGFEVLLDYIYSGNLAITAENSSAVLSAAICLQVIYSHHCWYRLNVIFNLSLNKVFVNRVIINYR